MYLKKKNITSRIIVFPLSADDVVQSRVLWYKTSVENDEHETGTRQAFKSAHIQSNIDFYFTERVFEIEFYEWGDILSKLGGLRSSILPIIYYFMPLLSMHFLWRLSGIIDLKMHQNQENELF